MQDTLVSLLPLTLMIGLIILVWRIANRKPSGDQASQVPPVLLPDPSELYKGPFSFVRRHFNGDYPLGRSYWVHTFLVQVAFIGLISGVLPVLSEDWPARIGSSVVLAVFTTSISLWLWGVIGTWRSSNKHVLRGGTSGWATLARVGIVLGAIRVFGDFASTLPALKEHWGVAFGAQHGPDVTLQVRADGRSILLSGGIRDGSAAQLEEALKMAPGVRTVVFASQGGWIREGERLGDVVRRRKLNTYVEQFCASACTVAFLAGVDRAAAPDAKIGFHASRSVGAAEGVQESTRLKQIYQQAGLPETFVQHALTTGSKEMWFPTQTEMIAAGVLTRRSGGGETAAVATSTRSREEFESGMRKVEIYDLLANRDPQTFSKAMDLGWQAAQQGATDAQVTGKLREVVMPAFVSYIPLATDSLVLQYHALVVQEVAALERIDESACASLVFGDEGAQRAVALLPKALREREASLLGQALREADFSKRFKPTDAQVVQAASAVTAKMDPDLVVLFGNDELRKAATPAKRCEAAKAYATSVSSLPQEQRARVLRVLFSAG